MSFADGMAASAAAANAGWTREQKFAVYAAICLVASEQELFTTDDIWARLPQGSPETKGVGSILNMARRRGVIENTGLTTYPQRDEVNHAQRLSLWRSRLINQEEGA